jgi:fumarate reductase (CoM/CoB) subunit A
MENNLEKIKIDLLVIGSEGAGAKIAIETHGKGIEMAMVTKGICGRSGATVTAGWGVQAPLGHMDPGDNPDIFFKDVVIGGDYLNNQKLAEKLTSLAVTEVPKLEKWGAKFVKRDNGNYYQIKLPGSSYPRTLVAVGSGGVQWRRAFNKQFTQLGIKPMEDIFITSLLLSDGQVAGAIGISLDDGHIVVFNAKFTVLATGGCGQIYLMTDTPAEATGDGMMLAYNAGAELMDMEFQQFLPTIFYAPNTYKGSSIATDFRYGLHPKFFNSEGEEFMEKYEPLAKGWSLRDPTSRAIYLENKYGRGSPSGGAFLSARHEPRNVIQGWIDKLKPRWVQDFKRLGIDIFEDAVEVGPGCHYSCGGVRVNEFCETTIPRLYAAGEVASGMDGAERIDGGPAIAWTQGMGYIVAQEVIKKAKDTEWLPIEPTKVKGEIDKLEAMWSRKEGVKGFEIKNRIKKVMWENVALVRNQKGLEEALKTIEQIRNEEIPKLCVPGSSRAFSVPWKEALEAVNLTEVSYLVTKAALERKESRKSHFREDYPTKDEQNWTKNQVILKKNGQPLLTAQTPVMTKLMPQKKEVKV